MASFLPGGAHRYLEILACHVDCRIRLLRACQHPAKNPQEAAASVAGGTAAFGRLVEDASIRLCGGREGAFPMGFVHPSQYDLLKQWCAKNVPDTKLVSQLAVKELVARGTLGEKEAVDRVRQLF